MALLTVKNLRLTRHGLDVATDLTFSLAGPRSVLVGAPPALFEAAAGLLSPAAGSVDLHGHRPLHAGAIAAYPKTWTALEWIVWRVRLGGGSKRAALPSAAALDAFGLADHGPVLLGKASALVRAALPLAAALALRGDEPAVILLDDTFTALDDETAHALAAKLVAAAGDTPWIAMLPLLPMRSPLATAATEAVVVDGGAVVRQGAPTDLLAQAPSYVVRVVGVEVAWAQKLAELGIQLVAERTLTRPEGTGKELTVAFGEGRGPRDLFALSASSTDVIVELFPASGKLA